MGTCADYRLGKNCPAAKWDPSIVDIDISSFSSLGKGINSSMSGGGSLLEYESLIDKRRVLIGFGGRVGLWNTGDYTASTPVYSLTNSVQDVAPGMDNMAFLNWNVKGCMDCSARSLLPERKYSS
jgi:hypothetical protein